MGRKDNMPALSGPPFWHGETCLKMCFWPGCIGSYFWSQHSGSSCRWISEFHSSQGYTRNPALKKKERSFVGSHPDLRGWGIVHSGYNGARLSTLLTAKINESGPWSHFPGWLADCPFQNCVSQNTTWGFCFKSWKVPYMWASVSVKTIAFT